MVIDPTKRLFTVEEFYRMAEAGVLSADERLELIEGEVFVEPAMGPRHAHVVRRLQRMFDRLLADRVVVSVQCPVILGIRSLPEPDIALLPPPLERYAGAHPGPRDIELLIEVADSTLRMDKTRKIPLYARTGIREVWLVNLVDDVVEVYRSPSADEFRERSVLAGDDTVSPAAFPHVEIQVREILG